MLGHVRYGTFGKNSIESVHPFLRQNNWMHRNLIVAGNFNLTNVNQLFDNLVDLGQHPKERADTVTIMEKIGHFLDDAVSKIYKNLRREGFTKAEASPLIAERLKLSKILRKASKNWDGGYAVAGLLGHGDSFVLRDPIGIRPVYYYSDDEIVVVASERPAIQTVFNISYEKIKELEPGHALITKRVDGTQIKQILEPQEKKSCSFERIYFSRGGDSEIYQERKNLGRALFPLVNKAIEGDLENTVFSFIPNTAETSFYGMINAVQDHVQKILTEKLNDSENPVYSVKFDENENPIICFSKTFDDSFNPQSQFAAIITCSSADEGCPFIVGAEVRFPIKYDDPKVFDDTALMNEKYTERSLQIASEMHYVFFQIKNL